MGIGFAVVMPWDPAIDREAMKEAGVWDPDFMRTLDAKYVIKVEGLEPQVFRGRALTRKEIRDMDGMGEEKRRERAFAIALRCVEGKRLHDSTEMRQSMWSPRDPTRPMRDDELDQFTERERQQVGGAVLAYSFCGSEEPAYVPLLATSLHAVIAAGIASPRRPAAPTKTSAAPSDLPKPPPEAPSPSAPTS